MLAASHFRATDILLHVILRWAGLLAVCLLTVVPLARGQTTVFHEPFDDTSQFSVTLGTTGGGSADYLKITDGSTINKSYTDITGSFFAGQDTDGFTEAPVESQWDDIDISGKRSLTFTGRFGEDFDSPGDIDDDDFLRVEYRIDGGAWHDLVAFRNDGTAYNSDFFEDTDFDGVGDGTSITSKDGSLVKFSKDIPETGNTLDLRFRAKVDAGDEDFAIDDFSIKGSSEPTVQFASSGTTVNESAGTTSLTVELSNPDENAVDVDVALDSPASSADAGDLNNFGTQTVSFPPGADDGATETVSLHLTDDTKEEGRERATFQLQNLTTGGNASLSSPSHFDLEIVDDDLSLPFIEDFEDTSLFTVESGALGTDGSENYFLIDDGSALNKSYDATEGHFLAGQDTDDPDITGGGSPVQIQWSGIDIAGAHGLVFTGHFGEVDDAGSSGGNIDRDDLLRVDYRIDGGNWHTLIALRNDGSDFNSDFFVDSDRNGIGEGSKISSASGTLVELTEKTGDSGRRLDLRFTAHVDAGDEDFAVDNFSLKEINRSPTAQSDRYQVKTHTSLRVTDPANGVLANDSDPNGETLTASLVTGPSNGHLQLNGDGTFTYTPDGSSATKTEFVYEASDPHGRTDRTTVTIGIIHPPVAAKDHYTLEPRDRPVFEVKAPGVLANDSDPNGDALKARLVEGLTSPFGTPSDQLGDLTFNKDGSFSYEPPHVHTGPVKFTYEAKDPHGLTDRTRVTIKSASGGPFGLIGILLAEPTGGTSAQSVGVGGIKLRWRGPARLEGALRETSGRKGSASKHSSSSISIAVRHRGPGREQFFVVDAELGLGTPNGQLKKGGSGQVYRATVEGLAPGTHEFKVQVRGPEGKVLASKKTSATLEMRRALRLEAPSPNPVRSATTIQFAVEKRAETRLLLYNVLGQKVRTLYRDTPPAGESQTVRLNTEDLPSGTYYLRMQAGGQTKTRRVTVLR